MVANDSNARTETPRRSRFRRKEEEAIVKGRGKSEEGGQDRYIIGAKREKKSLKKRWIERLSRTP